MENVFEIAGALLSSVGTIWVLLNNKLPNNSYNTLLKTFCIAWTIALLYITAFVVLKIVAADDACWKSGMKTDCPVYIQIANSIEIVLGIFVYTITFVLTGIPWYIVGHNGSLEQINPQKIIITAAALSSLCLSAGIPSETALRAASIYVLLLYITIFPGIGYFCARTWYRLRQEAIERNTNHSNSVKEYSENRKYRASVLMAKLSYITAGSTFLPFIITTLTFLCIGILYPDDPDMLRRSEYPIWLKLLLWFSTFCGTGMGAFFGVCVYYLFKDIDDYMKESPRLEVKESVMDLPDSGIDRNGAHSLNEVVPDQDLSISISDNGLDMDFDMSISRDFGQISISNNDSITPLNKRNFDVNSF
ncbi:hypothetical protein BC833DRAFT_609444 [Globomyces pollinis-pini]|nr:hypothetical protein BC833DRAFT_609444 [Globomyces pollinis-pini]